MTASGTTTFSLDMTEAIEESFERAGLESRSGYDMRTAKRSINLLLHDWSNRGVNLWTVDERSKLLVAGQQDYTLETDIVDLIEYMLEVPSNTLQILRYNLTRASVSPFAAHTNPNLQGRPTQVYVNRQVAAPIARLWP